MNITEWDRKFAKLKVDVTKLHNDIEELDSKVSMMKIGFGMDASCSNCKWSHNNPDGYYECENIKSPVEFMHYDDVATFCCNQWEKSK